MYCAIPLAVVLLPLLKNCSGIIFFMSLSALLSIVELPLTTQLFRPRVHLMPGRQCVSPWRLSPVERLVLDVCSAIHWHLHSKRPGPVLHHREHRHSPDACFDPRDINVHHLLFDR